MKKLSLLLLLLLTVSGLASAADYMLHLNDPSGSLDGKILYSAGLQTTVESDYDYESVLSELKKQFDIFIPDSPSSQGFNTFEELYEAYELMLVSMGMKHTCDSTGNNCFFAPDTSEQPYGLPLLMIIQESKLSAGITYDLFTTEDMLKMSEDQSYQWEFAPEDLKLVSSGRLKTDYNNKYYFKDSTLNFAGKTLYEAAAAAPEENPNYEESLNWLKSTISSRLIPDKPIEGCDTFEEYYEYLESQSENNKYTCNSTGENYFFEPLEGSHNLCLPLFMFIQESKLSPGIAFEAYTTKSFLEITGGPYQWAFTPEDLVLVQSGNLKTDAVPEPFCAALIFGLAALALRRR